MALVRYNPWKEMNALQRQINQLFNEDFLTSSEREFSMLRMFFIRDSVYLYFLE